MNKTEGRSVIPFKFKGIYKIFIGTTYNIQSFSNTDVQNTLLEATCL